METICPQCLTTIGAGDLNSGSELFCPSCGGSFRIEQNLSLPATGIRDFDTARGSLKDQTLLSPADDERTRDHSNDDNTISRLDESPSSSLVVSQQRLGRFVLFNVVGSGGFGDVYRAYDTDLQRVVAIKVPKSNIAERPDLLERVHREAKSAGQLHHPAIVAVLEWGESDHTPFIVYEFVTGVTLSTYLTQSNSRLDYRETATHIRDMAEGLHYAHEHGVTHRDVKPSNIMIDETGAARLTDFGLAKLQDPDTNTLTQTGDVLGTAAYMSPEQALGRIDEIDARSDIYSLGATLYEMLCGRRQFLGNPIELIHKAANEVPSQLRSLDANIPPDLEAICHKAVEKDRKHRYQSAQEMADDLDRWLNNRPTGVRRPGPFGRAWRWCRRNRVVAVATAIVLAVMSVATTITGLAYRDSLESLAIANERLSRQYIQKANSYPDEDIMLALPWVVAAAAIDKDNPERYAAHQARLTLGLATCPKIDSTRLHDGRIEDLAATADGRYILTIGDDGFVRMWDTAAAWKQLWCWDSHGTAAKCTLSDDGRFAAASHDNDMAVIWETATGRHVACLQHKDTTPKQNDSPRLRQIQFCPSHNGSSDNVLIATSAAGGSSVCIWDALTADLKSRITIDGTVRAAIFDGTGSRLVVQCVDRAAHAFTNQRSVLRVWTVSEDGTIPDPDRPLAELSYDATIVSMAYREHPRQIVTATSDGNVHVWDEAMEEFVFPAPLAGDTDSPRINISPDGRYLTINNGHDDNQLRIWDLEKQVMLDEHLAGNSRVVSQVFGADSRTIMIARDSGVIDLFRIHNNTIDRLTPRIHNGESATYRHLVETKSPGELPQVLLADRSGYIRRWVFPERCYHTVDTSVNRSKQIVCDSAGTRILCGGPSISQPIAVYDLENDHLQAINDSPTGEQVPFPHRNPRSPAISPDGQVVATGGQLGTRDTGFYSTIVLWDANTGRQIGEPLRVEDGFFPWPHIGFDSTSTYVLADSRVATGDQRIAQVWRVSDGKQIFSRAGAIAGSFWMNHGHTLCVLDRNAVEVIDMESAFQTSRMFQHDSLVKECIPSPDDRFIVTKCQNGTFHFWETLSGQIVGTSPATNGSGRIADVSSSAALVAIVDGFTVRLHSLNQQMPLYASVPSSTRYVQATFSSDGRLLLLVDDQGKCIIWDVVNKEKIGQLGGYQLSVEAAAFMGGERHILLTGQHRLGETPKRMIRRSVITLSPDRIDSLSVNISLATRHIVGKNGALELMPVENATGIVTMQNN